MLFSTLHRSQSRFQYTSDRKRSSAMRLSPILLPFTAAYGVIGRATQDWTDCADLLDCYNPTCTMSTEKLWHVKLFYNRKAGISAEEFNQYWAYKHGPLAEAFHLRLGVVKYNQVYKIMN